MKVLKFYATWCGPCSSLSETIKTHRLNELYEFEDIDIEEFPDRASQYRVRSVPTLVVLEGDREVRRSVGSMNVGALRQFLEIK